MVILPLFSGYRDDALELKLTNDYNTLWAACETITSEETPYDNVRFFKTNPQTGTEAEIAINKKRAKHLLETSKVLFNYNDIVLFSEWLPEIYDVHNKTS